MAKTNCPRVLFVATRETTYSRVAITRKALKENFSVDEIVCDDEKYWKRMLKILFNFLKVNKNNYDIVFFGFFAQPLFPLFRLFCRNLIVTDAYFSIYDTYVNDKGKASKNSLIGKYTKWLDRHMLKHSDLAFTDTNEHVDYMKKFFEVPEVRLKRLWIGAQENQFVKLPHVHYVDSEPFRILFWGGFIPLQGVEYIIQAASMLRDKKVVFDICGTGQTFDSCKLLANDLEVDSVVFHGWTQIDDIVEMAKSSHLVLGIFGKSDKASRVIPNKAFEALSLGKVLLTGDSPAARELLKSGVSALLCEMASGESIAEKISWAMANYELATKIGERGWKTFREIASEAAISELVSSEINQLKY